MIRRSRCSESGGLLRMRMGRASRRSGGLARVGHRQSRARVQRDKQRAAKVRQQQRGQSNPKLPRLPVATLSILDGSTVYVANEGANTVSVIATASNMVTAVIPVGIAPPGRGGDPGRHHSLCHELLPGQHRVGDRHGEQYGDRHDPRLLRAHRLRRLHRAASGASDAAFGNRVQRVFDGPFTGKVTVSEGSATRLVMRAAKARWRKRNK